MLRRSALPGMVALALVVSPAWGAAPSPARECLDRALEVAHTIELPGDQSAALRLIACVLADLSPQEARDTVAAIRRPSDAGRSLGAAAVALAGADPAAARQEVATAGRLLLRIPDANHRAAEQRLLLREVALLGEGALAAAPELPPEEAQLTVVLSRAASDPSHALELWRVWKLTGTASDRALAAIASRLAANPDQALDLAAAIGSAREREQAVWLIAEQRPAAEEAGIAQRVADPVVKSALLASAAARMATEDFEASQAAAREVVIAPASALAQIAVALASANTGQAIEVARGLPPRAREWALGQIAIACAASEPDRAESLLAALGGRAEIVRLTAAGMARLDPDRAIRVVHAIPEGEAREAALAAIVAALAVSDPERARDVVWQMQNPHWRDRAIRSAARQLAESDCDAATSLIGLVSEPGLAYQLRSEIAAAVADREPDLAWRLLESLPPSCHRTEGAFQAAKRLLSAGGDPAQALRLARVSLDRDLALRWLVPTLARSQVRSPVNLAEGIEDPYLQALSLVDAAREVLGVEAKCRLVPERARQIRPIVEWEGS